LIIHYYTDYTLSIHSIVATSVSRSATDDLLATVSLHFRCSQHFRVAATPTR